MKDETPNTPLQNTEEDRLLSPALSTMSLGHEDIEVRLLKIYDAGKLPHALIFSGPVGIGKMTFAYRFIRFLLNRQDESSASGESDMDSLFGEEVEESEVSAESDLSGLSIDPHSDIFSRIASGGHPDLRVIERRTNEKTGVLSSSHDLSEIRSIPSFLRLTPAEGGWRIAVVDEAERLNLHAQNALLKILEEPPENSLLILITRSAGALIPTIRSRSSVIEFSSLSVSDMGQLLEKLDSEMPSADKELLTEISSGQPGLAARYYEQGGLEAYTKVSEILSDWPKLDWPKIHQLADQTGQKSKDGFYECFQDITIWILYNLCRLKARNCAPDDLSASLAALKNLYIKLDLQEMIDLHDEVRDHFETGRRASLDPKNVVLNSLILFDNAREQRRSA